MLGQTCALETLLKGVTERSKAQATEALRKFGIFEILDKSLPKLQAQQIAGQGHMLPTGRVKVFTKDNLFQVLWEVTERRS